MFIGMAARGWHLERLDDDTKVWTHPEHRRRRVQPSSWWLDERGQRWPGGVAVATLDDTGEWSAGPTFYWVHEAMHLIETSGAPTG